jgi:hypothetical protein
MFSGARGARLWRDRRRTRIADLAGHGVGHEPFDHRDLDGIVRD